VSILGIIASSKLGAVAPTSVDYLVVAGGGGGGHPSDTNSFSNAAGGGGAGGFRTATNFSVTPGDSLTVTIGIQV
jgi:MSHA biogenesis protein MshQ